MSVPVALCCSMKLRLNKEAHMFAIKPSGMYIKKVEIKNVRSISKFEMEFADPAGWHVLIGDNGAGKSSILRSIALALIGPTDAQALRLPLINWIQQSKEEAEITLLIERSQDLDGYAGKKAPLKKPFDAAIRIFKENAHSFDVGRIERKGKSGTNQFEYIWSGKGGWFSTDRKSTRLNSS